MAKQHLTITEAEEAAINDMFAHMETRPALSEEEFDNIQAEAEEAFKADLEAGKTGHCFLYDYIQYRWNVAAAFVNPVVWNQVWFSRHPKYFDSYGHSANYIHKANYYISKAIACGLVDNPADAVKYFREHK